jgi:hypothetical protein
VHGLYPFGLWQPGEYVRDRYALRLPLGLEAGDYELRLGVLDPTDVPLPVQSSDSSGEQEPDKGRTTSGEPAVGGNDVGRQDLSRSLGTLHVHASRRLWEPPPHAYPVGARLGEAVELVGYDLDRNRAAPGEPLRLTLIWRALAPQETAYTVFTHLLDEGEQVRGQKDNPPVQGSYPTTLWVPGEVIVDEYEIVVAENAPPGTHAIEVGMYDPATMQRLPVWDPSGALGDRVLLGQVEVEQR